MIRNVFDDVYTMKICFILLIHQDSFHTCINNQYIKGYIYITIINTFYNIMYDAKNV